LTLSLERGRISLVIMTDGGTTETLAQTVALAVQRDFAARGYPLTSQRRGLIDLVVSRHKAFTADELLRESGCSEAKIGRATLFRTLDLLVQLGYLSKVVSGERKVYTLCSPGHHHHLTCSGCGEVVHFSDCPAASLLGELEAETGYCIKHHSLEITGTCPSCQAKLP
jgi:Fur family transcriptional regulator, ferric uptake regulator